MFNQPPQDSNPPKLPDISDLFFDETSGDRIEDEKKELTKAMNTFSNGDRAETVAIVEKISKILSPYFIVIVGLFLYEDNFLFGSALIIVGILSLLNISWRDINNAIEKIKDSLRSDDSEDSF